MGDLGKDSHAEVAFYEFSDTEKIIARLLEFFHRRKPWHRRLWGVGTVLALSEVIEYAGHCIEGSHQNTEGLRFVVATVRREVQRDPGLAPLAADLDQVLSQLDVKSPSKVNANLVAELEHLTERGRIGYLSSWVAAEPVMPVEFTARALGAHLLDGGFSADHLHRWLTAKASSIASVSDLAGLAEAMVTEMPVRDYEVFIPCARPRIGSEEHSSDGLWIDGPSGAQWLEEHLPTPENRRHNGGFVYSVEAHDPWSAVDMALELFHRTAARVRVARAASDDLRPDGWIRVAGVERDDFEARTPRRQVEIGSLERQGVVYQVDRAIRSPIDDSLELASYLEGTGTGAAVIGGWAAIEGLLIRPSEGSHYLAADRLAGVIACSVPRAELTPLSYAHQSNADDTLSEQLQEATSNRERVEYVETQLRTTPALDVRSAEDAAALDRIVAIINNPGAELVRVRTYITESLRRLYNQRNLVMHAGSITSVALEATLRTAPSLVGAGLDRLAHAHFSSGGATSPLDLVARSEVELRLVGTPGGRTLATLLE